MSYIKRQISMEDYAKTLYYTDRDGVLRYGGC